MKKLIGLVLCIVIVAGILGSAIVFANDEIGVYVNGQRLSFDVHPVIVDDRTLVPMRAIFEAFGMEVEWNAVDRTITASNNQQIVMLMIDSNVMAIVPAGQNPMLVQLEIPPQIMNDRTLVPVRAIAEGLKANVEWDGYSRTIRINEQGAETVATVNGLPITANDIQFMIRQAEQMLIQSDMELLMTLMLGGEIDYNLPFGNTTLGQAIREEAVRMAAVYTLYMQYARDNGIELDSEELDMIAFHVAMTEMQFGAQFDQALRQDGIRNSRHFEEILTMFEVSRKVMETIVDNPAVFANFEQYMQEPVEEILLGAKHILITFNNRSADEAEILATQLLTRARAGEDFSALISEYGEDPGMVTNPQGYTFVTGTMIEEFYEGTKALEIGEISELIPTTFGIHIIKRVEPDPNNVMRPQGVQAPPSLRERMILAVHRGFEVMVENAYIVFLPALDNVPLTW